MRPILPEPSVTETNDSQETNSGGLRDYSGVPVKDLLQPIPPISQDASCVDVLDHFVRHPELYAAAVVDEQLVPVGLADRNALIEVFIKPYTRDLFHRKTIADFLDKSPVIVDAHTSIDDLARIIVNAGMRHMVSGFIITQNGVYAGMGTGHDLLQEITRRKEAHLYHLAHYDQLTGLPNRLLFADRLHKACQNAKRGSRSVAVAFVDLDRFKLINDTFGHPFGDLLLKSVAKRLVACVRESDTVARLGGDEFTLILENIQHPSDTVRVAEAVIARLSDPHFVLGQDVRISASVGIALFPQHDDKVEGLVRKADAAMYQAKQSGRNSYQIFTESMSALLVEHMRLEVGLRAALENGELSLHYQPQVDLTSGQTVGVEALLRWKYSGFGNIPPEKFIPIAEETGLIVPLGEWVLREACRQQVEWRRLGLPALRMGVNVSAVQFHHRSFREVVRRVIAETGIDPHWLELELTEGVVMSNAESAVELLAELRGIGLRLAIDDFGTGYSSLSYLRQFPLDRLKIDQTFIRGVERIPANLAIIKTIIALANNLGLEVVAEGVETESQLALVKANRCLEVQGYHFSKPIPAGEFLDWYRRRGDSG